MKRHFVTMIAVAAALTAPAVAGAFTAGWSVEPAYTSMEQLAPGAYKVKRGMYTGIIDGNGKQIIKMTTDSITPFTEGKALVLTPVGNDRPSSTRTLRKTPFTRRCTLRSIRFSATASSPCATSKAFTAIWTRADAWY